MTHLVIFIKFWLSISISDDLTYICSLQNDDTTTESAAPADKGPEGEQEELAAILSTELQRIYLGTLPKVVQVIMIGQGLMWKWHVFTTKYLTVVMFWLDRQSTQNHGAEMGNLLNMQNGLSQGKTTTVFLLISAHLP